MTDTKTRTETATAGSDRRVLSETVGTNGQAVSHNEAFSILFSDQRRTSEVREQPNSFPDLNLDQFVGAVTNTRDEYNLTTFFYEHLDDLDLIVYRQEVFTDLEQTATLERIQLFGRQMREVRALLEETKKFHDPYQFRGSVIDIIEHYTGAVLALASGLGESKLESRGMRALADYLERYTNSPKFTALADDSVAIRKRLAEVQYTIRIRGPRVYVAKYTDEVDYSAEVLATFDRFKQGAAKDYRIGFRNYPEINHIEAQVLALVVRLYPEIFAELDEYCTRHGDFLDPTIQRFDREVQFYVSYLEYLAPLKQLGLTFCIPEVTRESKDVFARDTFDLVLATKLRTEETSVVCNDVELNEPERILVVSGPNQGGKTTYARVFGQLHYLAGIGCPVPGKAARLFFFDRLFTQFEREEDLGNMTGKLEDDLLRVRDILDAATPDSLVVLNEIFASTTLQDSIFLSTKVMERLVELDVLAVFVSFVEELASLGSTTVSMVSTIVPENPAERTFKVIRKPADGLAYALAIAEKYQLTYGQLRKRVTR